MEIRVYRSSRRIWQPVRISVSVGGDKFWDIPGSVADQVKENFSAGLNFGAGVELISHLQVGFNYGLGPLITIALRR